MVTLCNDVLVDIFSRLPIKCLFQLKCVCQRFNQVINSISSDPKLLPTHDALGLGSVHGFFHFSCYSPQNIRYLSLHPQQQYPIDNIYVSSIHSSHQIVDSCNGLLLLNFVKTNLFTLCNPTTKKHRYIVKPANWSPNPKQNIGLAYNDYSSTSMISNHHCQLVFVYKMRNPLRGTEIYGFRIFSSNANAWRRVDSRLVCQSGEFVKHGQAVYFNESLHWMRKSGDIIVFDTKENKPRIMRKSHFLGEFKDDMWFGVTNGSINIVHVTRTEVVVLALHDYVNGVWKRVRFKTNHWSLKVLCDFCPIFFDGELIVLQSHGNLLNQFFSYNIRLYEWKKIGDFTDSNDGIHECIPFIPSLAWLDTISEALNNNFLEENYSNGRYDHFWPMILGTRKRTRVNSQVPSDSRSKRVIRTPARFDDYWSDFL